MVSHIGIGRRDLSAEHHWQELNPATWNRDNPMLLILGGSSTLSAREANGYAKIFSGFMGLDHHKSIDVLAAYYRDLDPQDCSLEAFLCAHQMADSKCIAEVAKERREVTMDCAEERFNPHCIRELFDDYFSTLISENGTRLPLDEAKYRMRKMNVVTHCYGGYVMLKIEEMMSEKMKNLGYADDEQAQILKQMTVVSLAPPYGLGTARTTRLSMASVTGDATFTDRMNLTLNNFLASVAEEQKATEKEPTLGVLKLSDHEAFIGVYSGHTLSVKDQREHTIDYFTEGSAVHTKMLRCYLESVLTNSLKNAAGYGFTELPALEDAYVDGSPIGLTAVEKLPDYPERMRAELARGQDLLPRYTQYRKNQQALAAETVARLACRR